MTVAPSQAKINLYKLKYRVVYCSGISAFLNSRTGEDPDYPATELLDNSPQSRGWQSAKFCDYPQEIIFQFTNIVRLKQIQFLSHQSKIPQKIELYTFVPTGPQALTAQIPLNEVKFARLGYLSLDNNERSGYKARELKSVYVDAVTLLLKVVFNKAHTNKFNLYNQVGLIGLNCMGEMYNPSEAATGASSHSPPLMVPGSVQKMPANLYDEAPPGSANSALAASEHLAEELNIDKSTMETIKALYAAKQRAVQVEDFDEAKRLKDTIDKLKGISSHLGQLEERKRQAIENEDYEAAKLFKAEIEQLKQGVMYPQLAQPQIPQAYGRPSNLSDINYMGMTAPPGGFQGSPTATYQHNPRPHSALKGSFQGRDLYAQTGYETAGISGGEERKEFGSVLRPMGGSPDIFHHEGSSPYLRPQQQEQLEEPATYTDDNQAKKAVQNYDDQVIPTLTGKAGTGDENETDKQHKDEEEKDEELTAEQMQRAEPLFAVFGEEAVKKIFMKAWARREEGYTDINQQVQSKSNDETFVAGIQVANLALADKIVQIVQKGLTLLESIFKSNSAQVDASSHSSKLYMLLNQKLGDSSQRLCEHTQEVLKLMAGHKSFGANHVVQHLTRGQMKKQQQNSVKHITGRITLLNAILKEHPLPQSGISFQPCLEYGLNCLKHQNQHVRQEGQSVICQIYKGIGNKVRSHLSGLRQAQMELLEVGFAEIDGRDPNEAKSQRKSSPSPTKASSPPKKSGAKNGQAAKIEQTCQFCGKVDKAFSTGEALDLHYYKHCTMLTQCKFCTQIIEIPTYNNHLLKECSDERAKAESRAEEDASHICPLCEKEIGQDAWKDHLQNKKCPKNPRKS